MRFHLFKITFGLLLAGMIVGCANLKPSPRYNQKRKQNPGTRQIEKQVKNKSLDAHTDISKSDSECAEKLKTNDRLDQVINKWCGTRYMLGGNTCQVGVDCSGFTKEVMQEVFGIELPRNSGEQYEQAGRIVRKNDLRRGDLVFFGSSRGVVDHVGIYLGNGLFAHSASSSGVTVSHLNQDYYRNHYFGAKRVLP